MFNFYTFHTFLLITTLWLFCSSILIQAPDLYYNFNDLYTRLWLNEFFFNMYYFYWTSFWYLVVVVVITKLTFTLVYVRQLTVGLYIFITLLYTYASTICEYYGYSFINTSFLKPEYQINSLLSNSINKYHPLIFYFTLTWVYVISIHTSIYANNQSFLFSYKKQYLVKNLNYFLPMIFSTLGLGSWWALQEGSWGGWWNWDSSEVFGLLVMLFYVHLMHKKLWSINKQGLKLWSNVFLYTLLIIYTLIQLNFDLVSHNFGTKISQFINSDQLFYILLTSVTIKIWLVMRTFLKSTNVFLGVIKLKNFQVKIYLLVCLTITIVLLSFAELVNNFIWLLFSTNAVNIINLTVYYTPLTLLIVYTFLTRINTIYIVVFSYLNYNLGSFYLLCASVSYWSRAYNLHSIIYIFILITYSYINQSLIDWAYIFGNTHSSSNQNIIDLYTPFLKINTSYIEVTASNLVNNQTTYSGWNFIQWSTNQQAHTFQHNLSTGLTFQSLCNSLFEYLHSICVMDYASQILALLTLLWLIAVRGVRKDNMTILF
jgi:hypothetical protein